MKNKIKYTNEPTGKLKVIKDFLPPPEKLVLKEENVKVTIDGESCSRQQSRSILPKALHLARVADGKYEN